MMGCMGSGFGNKPRSDLALPDWVETPKLKWLDLAITLLSGRVEPPLRQSERNVLDTYAAAKEELLALLAAARAEVESLKCCGNCGHLWCEVDSEGWYLGCREQQREVEHHTMPMRTFDPEPSDSCHFTPSRWTPKVTT